MNIWQKCSDTNDIVPLHRPLGLYLKPATLLHISVKLPQLKAQEKVISNWEIMDKLKNLIQPEEFIFLKVSKSTLEFVRFDAEIYSKSKLQWVLGRLNGRTLKIPRFNDQLRIRAVETKGDFPTKYDWDSFFRDSKDMNEMKAGERPDTVHLSHLPCKWFSSDTICGKPSERLIRIIFEQFGPIKRIDIPMLDPYRNQMNKSISGVKLFTFNKHVIFEVYIQYEKYFCFVKCMDALRGMKLVHIDGDKTALFTSIKVDFDKTKHLSEVSIRRREIVRDRLVKKEKERMEAEMEKKEEEEKRQEEERLQKNERRKLREQKRKEKQLEKLKLKEIEDMNKKIAAEEYLLLMAQRKLESIRLLGELLNRIKNEKYKVISAKNISKKHYRDGRADEIDEVASKKTKADDTAELDLENDLRYKLIRKFKKIQPHELSKQKVKLHAPTTHDSASVKEDVDPLILLSDSDNGSIQNNRPQSDTPYRNGIRSQIGEYRRDRHMRWDHHIFQKGNHNMRDNWNGRGRFNNGRRGFRRRFMYQNSWKQAYQNKIMMPLIDPVLLTYSHEYYKYLQKITRKSRSERRSVSRSYSRSRSHSYYSGRTRSYSKSYSKSPSPIHFRLRWSTSRSQGRTRDVRDKKNDRVIPVVVKQVNEIKNDENLNTDKNTEQTSVPNISERSSASREKRKKNKKHKKRKKKKKR